MLTLFGPRLFRIVYQVVRYVVRGRCTSWIARSRVTRFCQRHVDEKDERCCLRSIHRGPIRPIGTHRLPRGSLVAAAQVRVCNRKGVFKSDFAVERIDAA